MSKKNEGKNSVVEQRTGRSNGQSTATQAQAAAATPPAKPAEPQPNPDQLKARQHQGPWAVCKNGNLQRLVVNRAKAISTLKSVSGVDAPPKELKDGSVMLHGVGHFRATPQVIES